MLNCQPNRRQFISTLAAGAVVAGLGRSATAYFQPPKVRTRKDVSRLNTNSPEIKAYRKAVDKMRQLPDTNALSWRRQAFIHGRGDNFGNCQHGSWYFHPWHRAYLHYFEEIIRELSEDESFALPYWNWSQTRSIPDFFYGAGNPLNDDTRVASQKNQISDDEVQEFVGPDVVGRIIRNRDYASFGGEPNSSGDDENTPHNFIHRWVGFRPGRPPGNMVRGQSPLDPIFWLHHSNIDRHFSNWLALGHAPPNDKNWLDRGFAHFFDRQGTATGGNLTVRKMLKSEDLGYVYEDFDVTPPTPVPPSRTGTVLAKLVAGRAMLTNRIAPFASAPLSDASALKAWRAVAADQGANQSVRLRIKNLNAPMRQEDQNVSIRVFVNCLDPSPETPITDPTYAGSFTFFDLPHENDDHHPSGVVLDATSAFRRVYGGRAVDANESVRVGLVSVPLFGEGEGGVLKEVDPRQVEIEVLSYV